MTSACRSAVSLLLLCITLALFGCGGNTKAVSVFEAAAQGWIQDNPAAAEGLYTDAVALGGKVADAQAAALAAKGDYLLRHDQTDEAKAAYAEALALAPRNPAVLAGLGDEALVRGDAGGALEYYESALKSKEFFAPALAGLGMVALAANDLPGATQWLHDAIAPEATDYEPGVIVAYERLIEQDAKLSGPFEAWLEERLSKNPTDLRSHVLAARYYQERGLIDQSLAAFGWVMRQRPDYPGVAEELARMQLEQGNVLDAIKLYESLNKTDPSADHLQLLAVSYANVPDYNNALALFEKGEAAYPGDYRFTLGRGQVLYSLGEPDAAYKVLRPLAEGGESYFEVYRELGLIEIRRGNWDEARRWVDRALAQRAFDEWANFQAAVLDARDEDRAAFEQHMQRVFEAGYVTTESLSTFDNYDLLMETDWAAAWIEEKRLVTNRDN